MSLDMRDKIRPYPDYKDSGVAWIGLTPSHWKTSPNRAIFLEVNDQNHPFEQLLSVTINQGVIPQKELLEDGSQRDGSRDDKSNYKLVLPGDIAYNKMRAWQGAIGLSNYRGIVSPAYVVQRPVEGLNPRYLHLLLRTPSFATEAERWSYGITSDMWSLRPQHFKVIQACVPPLNEQAAIVRYLDDSDQRIRAYVNSKERLITLLEEERQAVIHQAVTRGLDPNVRLKPSGVEWLGDVPEHWGIQQLKQKSRIFRGRFSHRPRNDASLYDGPYPFIQTGDIARAGKWITTYEQTLNDRGLAVSQMFPRGTLVMTIAANIGDAAILDLDACFPDSVVGFTPSHNVDRDYLYNLFQSMKTEFLRVAPVNTHGNLNVDRIGATIVAFPPLAEQTAIAAHLNQLAYGSDTAIDRARRQIELMEEYRTRLIADVVTGKIDVREAANIT